MNKKILTSLFINIVIVILEIIAAILSFKESGLLMFQYYTLDSNLFALFACLIYSIYSIGAIKRKKAIPKWVSVFKYISTCALSVTFSVVVLLICPILHNWKFMLLDGSGIFTHTLCPILSIISTILFEQNYNITHKERSYSLIFTIIYAGISLTLNILKIIKGPYPFLHVYEQPIIISFLWLVLILGSAYLLAFLIGKLNYRINVKYTNVN